jgi:hypothetical protein
MAHGSLPVATISPGLAKELPHPGKSQIENPRVGGSIPAEDAKFLDLSKSLACSPWG